MKLNVFLVEICCMRFVWNFLKRMSGWQIEMIFMRATFYHEGEIKEQRRFISSIPKLGQWCRLKIFRLKFVFDKIE